MPLTRSMFAEDLAHDEPQPYLWTMNFGPQHPATHTTLRLVLKLEGERVVDAACDIGYLHSGFEKLGESLDYNQYVTITDRMNYISPMANNVAWHLAVEKLMGIEAPRRCQYLRVIVCRIVAAERPLLCLGAMGLDIGAFTHFIYAFNPRETMYDIFEALCGARFTNSYTRVGGVMRDITPEAIEMIRGLLKEMPRALGDMERLLARNRIFVDRTQGVGVLSREEAIDRSCSGPVARASGVTRDLRRDEPYLTYGDFDFKVCCADRGRLPRPLPRPHGRNVGEHQDHPTGDREPARRAGERGRRPRGRSCRRRARSFSTIEGLISHFELVMTNRGFETPCEEVYVATEAPNGELGFYIVGDGSQTAYRARCRPPSFIHFALFPHLIRGHTLSDIWPCWEA